MDRTEQAGVGLSLAAHGALLAALSLGLFAAQNKLPVKTDPLDVQFVDEVGLSAAAPKVSAQAPAPTVAPEVGPPEEAAPAPAPAEPTPAPPAPPAPAPPTPAPPRPQPKPAPQPAPAPKPSPRPAPEKPAPKAQPTPAAKPAPAKPAPAKSAPAKAAPAKAAPASPPRARLGNDFLKGISGAAKSEGRTAAATGKANRGARLGDDFLKGVTGAKAGTARTPPAAISGAAQASLAAAIREQLARYWVPPSGPIGGLRTSLRVRLNRDGSIAGRPEVIEQTGVTNGNRGYARQHADAAIRTVFKAAPLKLPADLYDAWKLLEPLNFDATLER